MRLIISILIIAIAGPLFAQHDLTIQITEIKKVEGEVEVCLFDTEENYMRDAISCSYLKVSSKKLTHTFEGLKPGTYAVVIFQDLNGNRDLDTNWMRIPKEPYAFSNNPSTTFGPPSFEGASFKVSGDKEIELKLN